MQKLVSLIILNYNGEKFIREVLTSLTNSTYKNIEIIVVDNCSSDNSLKIISKEFSSVKIIKNSENLGFAEGNNVGIKAANGEYICLVNNDLKVDKDWLEPLVEFLEKNPQFGAVQPKILSWTDPSSFEYAGASGGYIDFLGIPFLRGRILNHLEKDTGQYDDVYEIFWASGAAICFKKRVTEEIGFLDKDFFLHQEEIDFCWRMHIKGYKLAVIPKSKVYHFGGASLNYENPFKLYLNYRNNLTMLLKNLTCLELFLILPIRIIVDMGAIFYKLLHGHGKHFWAILKGYSAALIGLNSTLKKRKIIKQFTSANFNFLTNQLVFKKSIVLEYYLRKKNKFSMLKFNLPKIK